MVAIKTLAISSLCFLGMTGMSHQQFFNLGSELGKFVDNFNWPNAFAKLCTYNQENIAINNKILSVYYKSGYTCPQNLRNDLTREYTCPSGAVGYVSAINWTPEFERIQSQDATIKAQATCLHYFTTGKLP